MDDQDYRRMKRLFVLWSIVAFLILAALTFFVNYRLNKIQRSIPVQPVTILERGQDGNDGYTPVKDLDYFDGRDGRNGKDSISTHTILEQPTYTNVPVAGPRGDTGPEGPEGPEGPQGQQGNAGYVVFIREVSPGVFECQFAGDSAWQPISECGP